jgi:hypothetical protein
MLLPYIDIFCMTLRLVKHMTPSKITPIYTYALRAP